ncbi:zinc finger and BTB domain-containing protein 40 isoform X2 [Pleurodeles waltl]|uniref:zinc finger and BTB domain-containing protein 40 isoform X2 n=1 Tax=Pleurodeles waltl TaxID=8319 RepID=UPI0037097BD8
MELPYYSRQLLLQLHTLCKEQHFCDCTIFIGTIHFRAHKLMLAAASLLFKSLLDDTDTISIDSSVVTAEEFTLLLEIVYTGKLPPGKHNLTKVISVADALQMFDVAVSCKKLLTDLMNRSTQSRTVLNCSGQLSDTTRKAKSEASQVKVIDDDRKIPQVYEQNTTVSSKVKPQPLTVSPHAEKLPHMAIGMSTLQTDTMPAVHGNPGKKTAFQVSSMTVASPGTFETTPALEDPSVNNDFNFATVAAPSILKQIANSENVENMIGMALSQTVTGSTHTEVALGSAPSEAMTCSTPAQLLNVITSSESEFELETNEPMTGSSPAKATTGLAPPEVMTGRTSPDMLFKKVPSEVVSDVEPVKQINGSSPVEEVKSPSPSEVETGQATSKVVTGNVPFDEATPPALSEAVTELASSTSVIGSAESGKGTFSGLSEEEVDMVSSVAMTSREISGSVNNQVLSQLLTTTAVSDSILATSEPELSTTELVTTVSSAEVELLPSSVAIIAAGKETRLEDSNTIPLSDKCELSSNQESPHASHSETTETKAVEHQTPTRRCRLSHNETNVPAFQTFTTGCDYATRKVEEEDTEPLMKKRRFNKAEFNSFSSFNKHTHHNYHSSNPIIFDGKTGKLEPSALRSWNHEKPNNLGVTPETLGSKGDLDFMLQYEHVFKEALSSCPTLLKKLVDGGEMEESEKQMLLQGYPDKERELVFKKILEKLKDGQTAHAQTVLYMLELCRDTHPALEEALLPRKQTIAECGPLTGSQEGSTALFDLLLEHKDDLVQSITELSPIIECLDTAEDGFLSRIEKKVILDCCEGRSHREAVENLLKKVTDEKVLRAESFVKLLQAVKEAFPELCLLLDALQGKVTEHLSPEEYGFELLGRYHDNLAEIITDPHVILSGLTEAVNLTPREREIIEEIVKKDSCVSAFSSLASAVLKEKILSSTACWQLVLALQGGGVPLNTMLEDIRKEPGAEIFFQSVSKRETVAMEVLLRHSDLIAEAIKESKRLELVTSGDEDLTDSAKELLSVICEKEDCAVSCVKQLLSAVLEKSVPSLKFCQLLCRLQESFPGLQPLMQELEQMGLLTGRDGEMKDIRKWKVNSEYQLEALDKRETSNPEPSELENVETVCIKDRCVSVKQEGKRVAISSSKKSYICKYCNKIFHFRCRLEVHVKRCRMALEKPVQCQECNEVKASKKELEKHRQEAHCYPNTDRTARGRKKRLMVTCDICGKEFAHPSGMQYHKRTEHFDEKPFSCSDCGAKFAANSTLKNHQRLHTGERPYMCKHCQMTFTQAAALAYHTKKKHSEGKMYACQYCDAVFAQSIELTRHVRTHTGDKPYVCRECGKGFSQANGLSVHLRTFHNIEDPYDCQKCRMSFPTLDEHRKHIQEVHSREYHPCPTCGKIFSAPSLLERHMVTHVGGKPYNCEICDKAYQLSGLWYHNRTHHPDIFAAQNRRSSKFTSLLCISCEKGFPTASALQKHVKEEHADMKLPECDKCQQIFPSPAALQVHMKCKHSGEIEGSQPFRCLYCTDAFRFPGALQHHVATEHFSQTENAFGCQLCGELFTSQPQLQRHYETEHPEVVIAEGHATPTQVMQVIHTTDDLESSEQVVTMEESQLTGPQLIVSVPGSQENEDGSKIVAVSMNDLLDGSVTLICGETK